MYPTNSTFFANMHIAYRHLERTPMVNVSFEEFFSNFFSTYKTMYGEKEPTGWSSTIENRFDAQIEFCKRILLYNELSHAPLKVGDAVSVFNGIEKLHGIVCAVDDNDCHMYVGEYCGDTWTVPCETVTRIDMPIQTIANVFGKFFWDSCDGSLLNVSEPVF